MFAFSKLTSIHTAKNLLIKLCRNGSNCCGPPEAVSPCPCCPNVKLPFNLQCKVGLVTGGESGIGFAIAGQLLQNGAKHVAITGCNPGQGFASMNILNDSYGCGKCSYINANSNDKCQLEDIERFMRTNRELFEQMKENIQREYTVDSDMLRRTFTKMQHRLQLRAEVGGGHFQHLSIFKCQFRAKQPYAFQQTYDLNCQLDCVVNSVGIFDGENWECEMMTNLISTIRTNILCYRYMSFENKHCGGVVLNIAGINAFDILPSAPTLCAAQHALVGLTRSFGDKCNSAKSGIRFVTLCPGFTNTEFLKDCDRKAMSHDMGTQLKNYLACVEFQSPEVVGKAGIHLIKCAETGTVWVCEDCKLFQLHIPKRKAFSNYVRNLI